MATSRPDTINLQGSVDIVREFFEYSINSILYQRGIYPPESFKRVSKFGLGMMVTTDAGLEKYLKKVLGQLEGWLGTGEVQRLVVVVTGVDSEKTLERWVFGVKTTTGENAVAAPTKNLVNEIQAIIRQITASVTFLPLLDEPCAFDLLVYTRKEVDDVPETWEDTDPKYITNANEVKLRSFTTKLHSVDAAVSYADFDDSAAQDDTNKPNDDAARSGKQKASVFNNTTNIDSSRR